MRLWIDLLTPKQVLFFGPLADLMRQEGHDVLITGRHYRELDDLAQSSGMRIRFAGERGGKDPAEQLRASISRMQELLDVVKPHVPDVALSVASADCARVALGLRVPHVAVNDSPHSLVAGRLSIPLSHHLLTPWLIPLEAWTAFGISRSSITRYRALDPAAWLKRVRKPEPPELDLDPSKPIVVLRLEESYAPYMFGTDATWTEKLLKSLVPAFRGSNIVILARYTEQLEKVSKAYPDCTVPQRAVDGVGLLSRTDLFVGMGGTMTTEAALMGVPAISAFQGRLLYTEKFLIGKGILVKSTNPREIPILGRSLVKPEQRTRIQRRARFVLDAMEDPVARIVGYLRTLA